VRRTGISRGEKQLRRFAELRRGKPLAGGSPGRTPMGTARRDTGPSAKVRAAVLIRDGYACAACGASVIGRPRSIQHRRARGMGGTSWPGVNLASNLVTLCGSATSPGGCHLRAEQRDPKMHERGFWLWSTQDPELVPVHRHGSTGPEWLERGGGVSFDEPTEGAA
jgi:hypothetical protein